jgi:hypothetical protein
MTERTFYFRFYPDGLDGGVGSPFVTVNEDKEYPLAPVEAGHHTGIRFKMVLPDKPQVTVY